MKAGQPGSRELSDGEFVTVMLEGVQPITVLAIPRAAVLSDQQGDYVYIVDAQNKAQIRRVQLGQSTPSTAVVTAWHQRRRTRHQRGPAAGSARRSRVGRAGQSAAHISPAEWRRAVPTTRSRRTAQSRLPPSRRRNDDLGDLCRSPAAGRRHRGRDHDRGRCSRCCAFRSRSFPDIVPPQVVVSAIYPGASADVVESSVAQPIEAQVVGVDKMIYMKSASGNDGSYTLTVSFLLGSDPDIDTVNVNNRVQTALAKLPSGGPAGGIDGSKKIVGDPAIHRALQRGRQAGSAVHHQLCGHQRARRACPAPLASVRPPCSARSIIRCASGSIPSVSTI